MAVVVIATQVRASDRPQSSSKVWKSAIKKANPAARPISADTWPLGRCFCSLMRVVFEYVGLQALLICAALPAIIAIRMPLLLKRARGLPFGRALIFVWV